MSQSVEERQQEEIAPAVTQSYNYFAWLLIVLPPVAFYFLLSRSLSSLPFLDDYNSVLSFLLSWKQQHGLQHFAQIVSAQHNEYKLMFESAIFGIQYSVAGHTNIKELAIAGNAFVVLMFGVLYLLWRQQGRNTSPLLFFAPASWLLFQLQYASSLNSAMAPLQNLTVIFFVLLTCYLAPKSNGAFLGSLACFVLAIASSGNGLFLIPIGCVLFLQRKQKARLALWLTTSLVMCVLYFHGYNFHASQTHADKSLWSSLSHISPAYGAAFLGSIAAKTNATPAIVLSIALFAIFLLAIKDGLYRSNPSLFYAILFFFVTGAAVSGLRSDSGLITALGSRYRINSAVLVILTYFYVSERYHSRLLLLRRFQAVAAIAVTFLILAGFTAASDRAGHRLLLTRRAKLEAAMLRWQRHEPRPVYTSQSGDDYTAENERKGFYEPEDPPLSDAIRQGIYRLPALPDEH